MHTETYEQLPIEKDLINNPDLLKEGQAVEINYDTDTDTPLTCELPPFVDLEVIEADPGVKGDTATNSLKRAVVETSKCSPIRSTSTRPPRSAAARS